MKKRATFAEPGPEEGDGEIVVATSPHDRLQQPGRSCLKEPHHEDNQSTPLDTSASPLTSALSRHHHVHFLTNSGTALGVPNASPAPTRHVVIDLNNCPQQEDGLLFR
jgi:hypothetical protein